MTKKLAPLCRALSVPLCAALFFLADILCSEETVKRTAALLILFAMCAAFLFYSRLRDRVRLPLAALGLVVLAGGVSCFYAVSGKFALYEFLKLLCAFCLTLLFLAFAGGKRPERQIASVLAGAAAIAGLVSVDLLSTHWISGPVIGLLDSLGRNLSELVPVEEGVRMVSLFMAPNVFAGCAGIGVLLGLGLAATAQSRAERAAQLVCLYVNSLSFVLVFSMGASGMIAAAFAVYLLLEKKEERISRLILMAETLAVTLLAAFPISMTAFTRWDGFQPVPLLCLAGGAALLCVLDAFVGSRAAERLRGHGRAVLLASAGIFAALAVFAVLACTLTGGAELAPGERLRRAAYPEPGTYTIEAEADGPVLLTAESQNRAETQMHTGAVIYRGPLDGASFTVPEGSEVVYFTFTADGETPVRLERAEYRGENGAGRVPLKYKLLPGFIANRLQGLFANENAIQRFAFFEDGLKLFLRSPLIGQGLGAFANGCFSVQSFHYATLYVHNHYIQTLDETGVVGLALFLGLLGVSAVCVWRTRRKNAMIPALGAALAFMAGHAAVEVVFSIYCYLPLAFGVFGLISLCCGDAISSPLDRQRVRAGVLLAILALLLVFGVLLSCNVSARRIADGAGDLSRYERAARLDRFEWADHLLSYVMGSLAESTDAETRERADRYAERLAELDSNVIPLYLAEYYIRTGRTAECFAMARKYAAYIAADEESWQLTFDLLERYEQDTPEFRSGVLEIAGMLEDWNANHLGTLTLTEHNEAFIARMAG